MGIEEDFGWVPPAERADPYVQSVVDLLSAFEKRFTSDGVLEFKLQTLMHRFKEDEKSYPAFQNKQKITVDKINRNDLYPGYFLECGVNTRTWTFWYQRFLRHDADDSKKVLKRPFVKEGDKIIFDGQEIDASVLSSAEITKEES